MKVVNGAPLWGLASHDLGVCDNTPVISCLVPPPETVMGITGGGGAV